MKTSDLCKPRFNSRHKIHPTKLRTIQYRKRWFLPRKFQKVHKKILVAISNQVFKQTIHELFMVNSDSRIGPHKMLQKEDKASTIQHIRQKINPRKGKNYYMKSARSSLNLIQIRLCDQLGCQLRTKWPQKIFHLRG